MSRALLLDAGNTLVYLDHAAVAAIAGLDAGAVERAEAPAKRRYEAMLREGASHEDGWAAFMRELLGAAGLASARVDETVVALRAAHDELNLWRRVPSGLPEALRRLRQAGWKLGVVSNSEGRLRELFDVLALTSLFEVIVDSGVVGLQKPDPRVFWLATEALGVAPPDAVYVGDIPAVDVDGARAAGLSAALVDTLGVFPDYRGAPRYERTEALIDDLREHRFVWESPPSGSEDPHGR
ncbi:MAG: HAD family hydrolase [Myxococcales bacterium]|nr:HAD family hydrolase [Myxococcales bacterium]